MADGAIELARAWICKAFGDLHTAKQIGGLPDGHLDVGIYHCQQAAEKALKGFLVFRGMDLERTHDLRRLIKQIEQIESGFEDYRNAADVLTPYSAAYRYPDEYSVLEPSREEFDEAITLAQSVYDFVLNLLPKAARP